MHHMVGFAPTPLLLPPPLPNFAMYVHVGVGVVVPVVLVLLLLLLLLVPDQGFVKVNVC